MTWTEGDEGAWLPVASAGVAVVAVGLWPPIVSPSGWDLYAFVVAWCVGSIAAFALSFHDRAPLALKAWGLSFSVLAHIGKNTLEVAAWNPVAPWEHAVNGLVWAWLLGGVAMFGYGWLLGRAPSFRHAPLRDAGPWDQAGVSEVKP